MRPEPAGGGIGVTGGTEILEQGEGGAGLGHGDLGRIGVHRLGQQHPRPPHLQRHLEEREGSQRLLEVGLLALEALGELGWKPVHGNAIAPGSAELGRAGHPGPSAGGNAGAEPDCAHAVPPAGARRDHFPEVQDAITENHRLHGYLVDGFRGVSYIDADGAEVTPTIRLVSTDPDANDWLAVNQVTIIQGDYRRRFDVVLYCNGMPVSVIELKKAGSQQADVAAAHSQLQTYLREFPMAFRFAVCTVASDGILAKYGTPFTPLHHFSPWNVDDDGKPVALGEATEEYSTGLEVALFGLFNQERFLQLQRSFTAFHEGADGLVKRIAKPHQYFAVTKAVGRTVTAVESNGKAGVVWHTQGSGKSMEMEL